MEGRDWTGFGDEGGREGVIRRFCSGEKWRGSTCQMRITLLMAPSLSCVFRIKPSALDLGAGVMEGSLLRSNPHLSIFSRVKFVQQCQKHFFSEASLAM